MRLNCCHYNSTTMIHLPDMYQAPLLRHNVRTSLSVNFELKKAKHKDRIGEELIATSAVDHERFYCHKSVE